MPDKRKATLQGSHHINSKRIDANQITTLAALVNLDAGNPASETVIPVSLSHTASIRAILRVAQRHAQPKQPIIWAVLNVYPTGGKIPPSIGGWDFQSPDTQNLGIELQICNSPTHFEVIGEFNRLAQPFGSTSSLIAVLISDRSVNHCCSRFSCIAKSSEYFLSIPYWDMRFTASFNCCGSFFLGWENTPRVLLVMSASLCLHRIPFLPASQLQVITNLPVFSDTVTMYTSILLLLVAKNSYSIRTLHAFNFQPLGSIPCFFNSALPSSFNQFAKLTPPALACRSNCSLSSGLMRMWNGGALPFPFGCLSLFTIVDMCTPIHLRFNSIGVHIIMLTSIKTTPRTVGAVSRRLTKPLIEVTVMAGNQHTQNHPKFTWRFLAVSKATPDMRPIILYTNAATEEEARDNCPGWILYFAARLPLSVPELVKGEVISSIPSRNGHMTTPSIRCVNHNAASNHGDISKVQGVRHA